MGVELQGHLRTEVFQYDTCKVTRELWWQEAGRGLACRLRFENTGDKPVKLHNIVPAVLKVSIKEDIELERFGFMCQERHKNGRPGVIRLYPPEDRGEVEDKVWSSDPFTVVEARADSTSELMLVGFLSFQSQLSDCLVTYDPKSSTLSLEARCEADGVSVGPGEMRSSEWLWIDFHSHYDALVDRYLNLVAQLAGIVAQELPPSVFCSWYYLDDAFSEEDLAENLHWLQEHPLPLDVIQIDECWDTRFGEWRPNHRWLAGMEAPARKIRDLGYRAGLWSAPFLVEPRSALRYEHPEWLLRRPDGQEVQFSMNRTLHSVLDPTHPEVEQWLEDLFRQFRSWGFTYHKLDFTRAVVMDAAAVFHDPTATRAEAYRRGLTAIRAGLGEEAYIVVCGGVYGPSLGIANAQRTGSDVRSQWNDHTERTIKQSVLRSWMGRLWHTDPDALMIRRRSTPLKKREMSLGSLSDSEALLLTLVQYLTGGITCVSERLCDLDSDRRYLWQHVIPAAGLPAVPRDLFDSTIMPYIYHTVVKPRCDALDPWHTVALLNWSDSPREFTLPLDESLLGMHVDSIRDLALVWEFVERRFIGAFAAGETLPRIAVPAHDVRLLRIAPWKGDEPQLLGTDLHFSGGGVEIDGWRSNGSSATFILNTKWHSKVGIWIAFPGGDARAPHVVRHEVVARGTPLEVTVCDSTTAGGSDS